MNNSDLIRKSRVPRHISSLHMYDIVKRIFLKFCIGLHQESVPNIIDITADDEIPSVRIPDEACTSNKIYFLRAKCQGLNIILEFPVFCC